MIINGRCDNVSILYAKSVQGKKDPSRTFYSLGLWFQGFNETGEISCNEEIYKQVFSIANEADMMKKMSTVFDFETTFNTQFQSFQLTKVVDTRSSSSAAPAKK